MKRIAPFVFIAFAAIALVGCASNGTYVGEYKDGKVGTPQVADEPEPPSDRSAYRVRSPGR